MAVLLLLATFIVPHLQLPEQLKFEFLNGQSALLERTCERTKIWNLVNFNEKITNVSFKELKKRLTAWDYFKDFIFDGTAVSTSRHRVSDYVYF